MPLANASIYTRYRQCHNLERAHVEYGEVLRRVVCKAVERSRLFEQIHGFHAIYRKPPRHWTPLGRELAPIDQPHD